MANNQDIPAHMLNLAHRFIEGKLGAEQFHREMGLAWTKPMDNDDLAWLAQALLKYDPDYTD